MAKPLTRCRTYLRISTGRSRILFTLTSSPARCYTILPSVTESGLTLSYRIPSRVSGASKSPRELDEARFSPGSLLSPVVQQECSRFHPVWWQVPQCADSFSPRTPKVWPVAAFSRLCTFLKKSNALNGLERRPLSPLSSVHCRDACYSSVTVRAARRGLFLAP